MKDPEGAVVPGATVTATNRGTQLSWNTVTDGTGFYTFPNLNSFDGRQYVAIAAGPNVLAFALPAAR